MDTTSRTRSWARRCRVLQVAARVALALLVVGVVLPASGRESVEAAPSALPAGYEVIQTQQVVDLAPGGTTELSANCSTLNKSIVGGGAVVTPLGSTDVTGLTLSRNAPLSSTAWGGDWINFGPATLSQLRFEVRAICADISALQAAGWEFRSGSNSRNLPPQTLQSLSVGCSTTSKTSVAGGVRRNTVGTANTLYMLNDGKHFGGWVGSYLNLGSSSVSNLLDIEVICLNVSSPLSFIGSGGQTRETIPAKGHLTKRYLCPGGSRALGGGGVITDVTPNDVAPQLSLVTAGPVDALAQEVIVDWFNFGTTPITVRYSASFVCTS